MTDWKRICCAGSLPARHASEEARMVRPWLARQQTMSPPTISPSPKTASSNMRRRTSYGRVGHGVRRPRVVEVIGRVKRGKEGCLRECLVSRGWEACWEHTPVEVFVALASFPADRAEG